MPDLDLDTIQIQKLPSVSRYDTIHPRYVMDPARKEVTYGGREQTKLCMNLAGKERLSEPINEDPMQSKLRQAKIDASQPN